jgi:uncharacterized membrane protein
MAKLRLHRRTSLRAGQILLAVAFVELMFGGFFSTATSNFVFTYYATGVFIGLFGLVLLLISPFLPQYHEKGYRGMEKLLSREKLHYGNYAQGNWRTALDEMDKEDKEKRKPETDHQ